MEIGSDPFAGNSAIAALAAVARQASQPKPQPQAAPAPAAEAPGAGDPDLQDWGTGEQSQPEGNEQPPTEPDGPEGEPGEGEDPTLNLSSYKRNKEARVAAEERAAAAEARIAAIQAEADRRVREAQEAKAAEVETKKAEEQSEADWKSTKAEYMRGAQAEYERLVAEGKPEDAANYLADCAEQVAQAEADRRARRVEAEFAAKDAERQAREIQARHAAYKAANPTLTADLAALDDLGFGDLINLDAVKKGGVDLAHLHALAKLVKAGHSGTPEGVEAQVSERGQAAAAKALADAVRAKRTTPGLGSIPSASADLRPGPQKLSQQQWEAQQKQTRGRVDPAEYLKAVARGQAS